MRTMKMKTKEKGGKKHENKRKKSHGQRGKGM